MTGQRRRFDVSDNLRGGLRRMTCFSPSAADRRTRGAISRRLIGRPARSLCGRHGDLSPRTGSLTLGSKWVRQALGECSVPLVALLDDYYENVWRASRVVVEGGKVDERLVSSLVSQGVAGGVAVDLLGGDPRDANLRALLS